LKSLPVSFSELGLLQISVPTGYNEVSITLNAQREEKLGKTISLISVLLSLFFLFLMRWKPSV